MRKSAWEGGIFDVCLVLKNSDPNGGAHGCTGPSYAVEFCPGGVGAGISPSGVPAKAQATGGAIVGGTPGGSGSSNGPNNGDDTSQAVAPTSTAAVVSTSPAAVAPTSSSTSAAAPGVVTSSEPAEAPAASTSTAGGRGGGSYGGGNHYTGVKEVATDTAETETKTITRDGTVVIQVWVTETARKRAKATTVKRLVAIDKVDEE